MKKEYGVKRKREMRHAGLVKLFKTDKYKEHRIHYTIFVFYETQKLKNNFKFTCYVAN